MESSFSAGGKRLLHSQNHCYWNPLISDNDPDSDHNNDNNDNLNNNDDDSYWIEWNGMNSFPSIGKHNFLEINYDSNDDVDKDKRGMEGWVDGRDIGQNTLTRLTITNVMDLSIIGGDQEFM